MSSLHPTGWKPEPIGSPLVLGARPSPIGAFPDSHAIARPDWLLDQHGESCFGHVFAQWLWMLLGVKGSPYVSWWAARLHDTPGRELFDLGVTASAGLAAGRQTGTCDWLLWNPSVPGFGINVEPPGAALISAQSYNADASVLLGSGQELIDRICYELSRNHPCACVVAVDSVVDGYRDGIMRGERGPARGYHIMPVDRYRTVTGNRVIGGINSWANWSKGQRFELSRDRVLQSPLWLVCRGFS